MDPRDTHSADARERLQAALADQYVIERELGRGGMGAVYRARDLRHRRSVALKVLAPEFSQSLGAGRFLREIEVAAGLAHPHIVALHDSGEADGLLYFTMPLVDGESLRYRLTREGPLPVDDAVRIARDVADALDYAHGRGIVHRDIKPENILLQGGHALVADFGIARAVSKATEGAARETLTQTGVAVGTPAYMSPEQAAGEQDVDGRSDVYALGCVVYEMLTGNTPFTGTSAEQMARRFRESAPAPSSRRAGLPQTLDTVLARALTLPPDERYPTAGDFAGALAHAAVTLGDPRSVRTSSAPRAVRHRALLMGTALVVVGAVAGGGWWMAVRRGNARSKPNADRHRVLVMPFANRTGESSFDGIGPIAADWITRGLLESGLVDVVDPVQASLDVGTAGAGDPLAVAGRQGAGTLVTGEFYRLGDSLQFQARVTDVADHRVARTVESVVTARAAPLGAVERLRNRVTGALAMLVEPDLAGWSDRASQPPNLEAYREFMEARSAYLIRGGPQVALEHYYRAARLDTSFTLPLVWAASVHLSVYQCEAVDSIDTALRAKRDRLPAYDRYTLAGVVADCHGDSRASFESTRELARLVPRSQLVTVQLAGLTLSDRHRPDEALALLAQVDPTRGDLRGEEGVVYYLVLGNALHFLGQHARELSEIRRGRKAHPRDMLLWNSEFQALAALRRVSELNAAISERLKIPMEGITEGVAVGFAASELAAHGDTVSARAVWDRVIAWYRNDEPERRARNDHRFHLALSLLAIGQLAEAKAIVDSLSIAPDDTVFKTSASFVRTRYIGASALVAAKQHQADRARRLVSQLDRARPEYFPGEWYYWRAVVAVALGDKQRAIAILREGADHELGTAFWVPLHADPFLSSLQSDPAFVAFLREPR